MYAHIGRLAILHISTRTFISTFKEKENVAISGIRTPKKLSGNGFTKTATPHLRSIVPNVKLHMAYFAAS